MNNPNPFSTPEGILEVLWRDGYHAAAKLIEQLQNSISRKAELAYLKQFAFESSFDAEVCRDQLRSLWTAYCFHHDLDVDTAGYDFDLRVVWDAVASVERRSGGFSDFGSADSFDDFDSFDQFMCKELV